MTHCLLFPGMVGCPSNYVLQEPALFMLYLFNLLKNSLIYFLIGFLPSFIFPVSKIECLTCFISHYFFPCALKYF